MRQPHLRLLCLALAAVVTGAGAGFAFLQTFPVDAAAPVTATPTAEPAAASWPPTARQPAPVREGTPAPGQIYSAPPPPPSAREQPKPATAGKKYTPPPRSKLAMRTPHITIDADALEEAIADADVPLRIRRWHLHW